MYQVGHSSATALSRHFARAASSGRSSAVAERVSARLPEAPQVRASTTRSTTLQRPLVHARRPPTAIQAATARRQIDTTMEVQDKKHASAALQRHLATLKLVSRLLGHELHAQSGAKAIALSREEVVEIQTTIDLYIEEATRKGATAAAPETTLVTAGSRN